MPSRNSSEPVAAPHVRKIAVIGAGALGAVVVDLLVQEQHFDEIVVFERRNVVGGIWVYDGSPVEPPAHLVRPGASLAEMDPPLNHPFQNPQAGQAGADKLPRELQFRFEQTPSYEKMSTNIIEKMMTFSDEPQWPQLAKYVDRAVVHEYLARYMARHQENRAVSVRMATTVEEIERVERGDGEEEERENGDLENKGGERSLLRESSDAFGPEKPESLDPVAPSSSRPAPSSVSGPAPSSDPGPAPFVPGPAPAPNSRPKPFFRPARGPRKGALRLTLRQLAPAGERWTQEVFDAVVVATGHYHVPHVPDVPGAADAFRRHPERFEHAKFFRSGEKYAGQTILVVGSRSLGADITRAAAQHAHTVYQLVRSPQNTIKRVSASNVVACPEIARFEPSGAGFRVLFADGSVLDNPHKVVYATGYLFLYPFLARHYGDITARGAIVPGLYQHTFLVDEPLVAFVGVPTDAVSFRVFEFQAILVARYFAGRISLPLGGHQRRWLSERLAQFGPTRQFHTIGAASALLYMRTLAALGTAKSGLLAGRQFPAVTQADIDEYVAEAMLLAKSWN